MNERDPLKTTQDDAEDIADALREAVGEETWNMLLQFNTYASGPLNVHLQFFRSPNGNPACRFYSVRQ